MFTQMMSNIHINVFNTLHGYISTFRSTLNDITVDDSQSLLDTSTSKTCGGAICLCYCSVIIVGRDDEKR
jgi:hypothetical protein